MRSSPALAAALAVALMLLPTIAAQDPAETVPMPPATVQSDPYGPGNDHAWNATEIWAGQTFTQSLANATPNSWWETSACTWGPNLWFRVRIPNATGLRVDMTGSTGVDAIGVYRWYPSYENNVGCAFGGNATAPVLERGVLSGYYYIEVAGYGDLSITVTTDDSLAPYELRAPYAYVSPRNDTVVVGEPVDLGFAIQSLGKPIDQPFSVYWSIDGWYTGEIRVESMHNFSWMYVHGDWTPQWAGNHTLHYWVDTWNEIPEFSENDNYYSTEITVLPAPDITVNITRLERVPLRTELGELRDPRSIWEMDVEVCNLGGGYPTATVNLTLIAGGEWAGGSGSMSLGSFVDGAGQFSCGTRTMRFSTLNAIGDFTVLAEGSSPRDHSPWNNDDRAYGYNVVAENGGIVLDPSGLLA